MKTWEVQYPPRRASVDLARLPELLARKLFFSVQIVFSVYTEKKGFIYPPPPPPLTP